MPYRDNYCLMTKIKIKKIIVGLDYIFPNRAKYYFFVCVS